MIALTNRQLATDSFIGDLREKLFEVEVEQNALRDKLTNAKCRLKDVEDALEKVWGEADGERATVATLRTSLDEVKS